MNSPAERRLPTLSCTRISKVHMYHDTYASEGLRDDDGCIRCDFAQSLEQQGVCRNKQHPCITIPSEDLTE